MATLKITLPKSFHFYRDILKYEFNNLAELHLFTINEQRIHTWEIKRDKRFPLAESLGMKFGACSCTRRFKIFQRIAKKKHDLELQRQKHWDSDV